MIRTFVIDDEPTAIEVLSHHISQIPYLTLTGSATDPVQGLMQLQQNPADVLFLDIQMPKLSGIDVIKLLSGRTKVIITSAYTQYALDGFEHNVVDYLLKPVSFERFARAVQKLITDPASVLNLEQQPAKAANVLVEDDFIFVKADTKGKYIKVNFTDIIYIEGLKNYLSIYLGQERVITLLSIKEMQEKLVDKGFIRVHKSYIVALNRIKAVDGNQIIIQDKKSIPLGDIYRTTFFAMLNQYMMDSQRK